MTFKSCCVNGVSMIRVIYHFDVLPEEDAAFEAAWRAIVAAHAGDGALGSMLLRREEGGYVAISRWESREVWEANRRDDAAPEAYAVFRRVCEVTSRQVLEEIAVLGA